MTSFRSHHFSEPLLQQKWSDECKWLPKWLQTPSFQKSTSLELRKWSWMKKTLGLWEPVCLAALGLSSARVGCPGKAAGIFSRLICLCRYTRKQPRVSLLSVFRCPQNLVTGLYRDLLEWRYLWTWIFFFFKLLGMFNYQCFIMQCSPIWAGHKLALIKTLAEMNWSN